MTDHYTKYSYTSFYAQTDRYGLFNSVVVAVIAHSHDDDDSIRDAVDDLEGGDNDAFEARDLLEAKQKSGDVSIGTGSTFTEAAKNADIKFSAYYSELVKRINK